MAAKAQGHEIIGARHGIRGIIEEDFIALHELDDEKLKRVAKTPSSALGSTRDKPDQEYCTNILNIFQKHTINAFFYIGGNDSSETIRLVNEAAQAANYDLKGFHIPKTVDNDLMENDHTPGFASAARFVVKAMMGLNRDNAALPGVHLCIIMGRHAGFLTASAGLGGAHRIYLPEVAFDLEEFAKEVKETVDQEGRAVIAISEGIQDKDGNPIISHFVQDQEKDAHGNIQLSGLPLGNVLADYLKDKGVAKRVRQDTFGYPQRCYPDASPVDQAEAYQCGEKAVELLDADRKTGSIVIKRVSNDPYQVEIDCVDLDKVANLTRHMPEEYFDNSSKTLTEAGKAYFLPLLGELPIIETL